MRELIILCFTILFLPLSVAAEETGLKVEGGTPGTDYTYDGNICTILKNTSLTISGTTTTDNIVVGENVTANITIDGINIDLSSMDNKSAIDLKENATLNLTLANASTLISGKAVAGIHLSDGSCLTITEGSNGYSLMVTGGGNDEEHGYAGAGIGRNPQEEGNATLKIEGGDVTANGGKTTRYWGISGDGIGKNAVEVSSHLTIDISGGSVVANGGDKAFIGYGGNGINGIIQINGGSVTAKGKGEADITGNVTVEGGTITDCTFGGEVIIKSGTFTNCTFKNITSLNEETSSFTTCKLNFKEYITLTKSYKDCTLSGNMIIKGSTISNNTLNGNIIIEEGTFTNCIFTGESFLMNKGTINNTDGSNIAAK